MTDRTTKAARPSGSAAVACASFEDRTTPAAQQVRSASVGFWAAPSVQVFDGATGQVKFAVRAYDSSVTGGGRVAIGADDGGGTEHLISGAGPTGGAVDKVSGSERGTSSAAFSRVTSARLARDRGEGQSGEHE